MGRNNVLLTIALLGLGISGVALAGVTANSARTAGTKEISVSLLEGKLAVSATTLTAGKITLVAVNKGKQTHGLAIMGTGLSPKRTPTIAVGKTARLTVTLKVGKYHLWDPVRSSMSHAKLLTVVTGSSAGVSSGGTNSSSSGSGSTGSSGGGSVGTGTTMDDGMDGMEH